MAEQQRHHRAKVDEAGATPAGHSSIRPVTQRVFRTHEVELVADSDPDTVPDQSKTRRGLPD